MNAAAKVKQEEESDSIKKEFSDLPQKKTNLCRKES